MPATFQVPCGHTWRVAILLDSTDIAHVHYCRKFYWTVRVPKMVHPPDLCEAGFFSLLRSQLKCSLPEEASHPTSHPKSQSPTTPSP